MNQSQSSFIAVCIASCTIFFSNCKRRIPWQTSRIPFLFILLFILIPFHSSFSYYFILYYYIESQRFQILDTNTKISNISFTNVTIDISNINFIQHIQYQFYPMYPISILCSAFDINFIQFFIKYSISILCSVFDIVSKHLMYPVSISCIM